MTLASLRAKRRRGGDDGRGASGSAPQMGLLFGSEDRRESAPAAESPSAGAARAPGERLEAGRGPVGQGATAGGPGRADEMPVAECVSAGMAAERDDSMPWERVPTSAAAGQSRQGERRVWGVRAVVADLRQRVEGGYGEMWVEGEISNCRGAASGHLYLTLKEGETQLPTVLFRRQAQLLRFRPTAGMAVLVRGRLSVYEGRGELQLIAEMMEPRGAGALLVAFEQLKARLAAEGLFRTERKRPLPAFPRTVGLVTSMSGAVLHDVITVVRRRHARLNLLVYPATVQGPGCAGSVMAGLRWFNANPGAVELIVLARGGGSPEDLAGFNDERLARAIAGSRLPVVSAIGHETDFTIADFVADLRAPTPSAAAEMMTESQHRIEERLGRLEAGLRRSMEYRLMQARGRLARVGAERMTDRVQRGLDRRLQRVDEGERRLRGAAEARGRSARARVEALSAKLERHNPGWRLGWDRERLQRLEERLRVAAPGMTVRKRARVEAIAERLARVRLRPVERQRSEVERMEGRLRALSPVAVLERGYALVYNLRASGEGGGTLVRSSRDTAPGQRIWARLAAGSLTAEIVAVAGGVPGDMETE